MRGVERATRGCSRETRERERQPTMISDVLFEALQEIERYQREMPDVYSDMAADIERVKVEMQTLQRRLDTPPAADAA